MLGAKRQLIPLLAISLTGLLQGTAASECGLGQHEKNGSCVQCAPGRFQKNQSHQADQCDDCQTGRYSPMPGMSECWRCPKGSNSSIQAASCYMNLACQPCTDRTTVKVRAVLHGRTSDNYFLRIERAMQAAAKQLKVDFGISLQDRVSMQDFMTKIAAVVEKDAPDILLVSIPDAQVAQKVRDAAQDAHVFSINSGIAEFKASGSKAHFGVDDDRSGYDSAAHFNADFAGSPDLGACAVVYVDASGLREQNLRRRQGFERACNESGWVWAGDAVASSAANVQDAVRSLLLRFRNSPPTPGKGLGLLVLSTEGTQGALDAHAAAGSPSDVRLGLYGASDDAYNALGQQAAFLIRDNEWLQGYLSVFLGVIYVTTGNLMAPRVYRTEEFITSKPTQAELNQTLEGYPMCDCPWAGGNEEDVVCQAADVLPIGRCPKTDSSCVLPCRDPRKVRIAAVTHGDEADAFWFIVKAGAEQAANDLRLQDFEMDLFGPRNGGRSDAFTPDFFSQRIRETAQRDDLDGLIVSIPGNFSHLAISEAAKRTLLVTINAGDDVAAALNPPGGNWLTHVGQEEMFAGEEAGRVMLESGVTHLLTATNYVTDSVEARIIGIRNVFHAAGKQVEEFLATDFGVNADDDDAIYATLQKMLKDNPWVDGVCFLVQTIAVPGLRAIQDTRTPGLMFAGTFDVPALAVEDLDRRPHGFFTFAIDQQPYMQGYMSVLALWLRKFTGLKLQAEIIRTGPFLVRQSEPSKDHCVQLPWTEPAEKRLGDVVVGEGLLPSADARQTVGFPVCPYGGDCSSKGQYFNTSHMECRLCPAGRFKNASMATCQDCPSGSSTGGFAGTDSCQTCRPGRAAEQGAADCANCQRGFYADSSGMATCVACSDGLTTRDIASNSPTACGCKEGTFFDQGTCHPCLEGMICALGSNVSHYPDLVRDGGDSHGHGNIGIIDSHRPYPVLMRGFWADLKQPLSVFECSSDSRCPGGDPSSCAGLLQGRACQHCAVDFRWAPAKGTCEPCPADTFLTFLLPVVLLLATVPTIGILYYTSGDPVELWGSWQNGTASIGFVALVHYQMISLIGNTSVSHKSADMLSRITAPWAWTNNVFAIFDTACTGFASMGRRLVGQALVPIVLLLMTMLMFCISRVLSQLRQSPKLRLDPNRLTNAYMSVIFTFFSAITASSLLLFQCVDNPNGLQTLAADRSILCFRDGQWMSMLAIAIAAVFCYVVVCGAVYVWAIVRAPRLFQQEAFRVRWKFLFLKFRADAYWWSLVFLGKTFILNLTFVVSTWAPIQLLMLVSINMVYGGWLSAQSPHRFRVANWLDLQSSFSIIWVCSVALWISENSEASGGLTLVKAAHFVSFLHMSAAIILGLWIVHRKFGRKRAAAQAARHLAKKSQNMFQAVSRIQEQEWNDFCTTIDELDQDSIFKTTEIINAEFFYSINRTSTGKFRNSPSFSLDTTHTGSTEVPTPSKVDSDQCNSEDCAKVSGLTELDRYVRKVII